MAFYRNDPIMASSLKDLIYRLEEEGRPGLRQNISISWIRYDEPNPIAGSGRGTGWLNTKLIYPASIVKLVYGIAIEAWIQENLITDSEEIRTATYEMLANSSNNATSLIVDILTATTSGSKLKGEEWEKWQLQRKLINQWLQSLKWEELKGINCCQKTWDDGPYGREKDFYGFQNNNRNALSTDATARLLEAIMTDNILSPLSTKKLRNFLSRSLDIMERKANPENQVDGFIGEGIARSNPQLWSKAGLMSQVRHDAAWWYSKEQNPMLLIIFTNNEKLARDSFLLPAIANELNNL